MTGQSLERLHYGELLEELKNFFPSPISNPISDGYFVHTLSRFLDRVDDLKSTAPILRPSYERRYPPVFESPFPEEMQSVEEVTQELVDYCRGMQIWGHPKAQVNVIPSTTIPSITAMVAAALLNPNLIWDEYAGRFARAEIEAVAMLADLVGYDPREAGGLFTFGGTGTILYGVKLGLEKYLQGQGMTEGLRTDLKVVASASSHYARLNVAAWLGLGTKNLVTIPSTRNDEMSLADLEDYLRQAYSRGEKVAVIIATLGTTEAFGLDDLAAIVELRDGLAREYQVPPAHIHADAVIGWAWAVFRDYDFEANPLGFHARTLRALKDTAKIIGSLGRADSLGVDFHKTGYVPYISSAFVVRRRQDLTWLSRHPEEMPYLYQFGQYRPGIYTLECSRSAGGALAALANMRLLGKQGFRVLIGHVVEMASMLRERLEQHPFIEVLNTFNFGPVTLFRVYPEGVNAKEAFERELCDPGYRSRLEEHNDYNRRIFRRIHDRAMAGQGVLLSWTSAYRHAEYKGETGPPIAALKSFILSPWTDLAAVDLVVRQILEVREQLAREAREG